MNEMGRSYSETPTRVWGVMRLKRVFDALENDTKMNFLVNIPGKVQFQNTWKEGIFHYPNPFLSSGNLLFTIENVIIIYL